MMKKKIGNLQEFVNEIATMYGNKDAYRYIVNDTVVSRTYSDLQKDVHGLASYLVNQGFSRKHIAILGGTSYEWIVTFLAVTNSNNVVIPLDKMLPKEEILNLLVMGDVEYIFVSSEFRAFIEDVKEADNQVEQIVCFDDADYACMLATEPVVLPKIDVELLTEILFTSGTTGTSKGVMLCQKNIVCNINSIAQMNYTRNVKAESIVLSVLPVNHTFELTVDNLGVLYCGATICINDKLENIVTNLQRFKPAVILVVPAIAEVFYKKVREAMTSKANKKKIAQGMKLNHALLKMKINNTRKIFKSLLDRFGGNLTNIIVGGAALRPEIPELFAEFGIEVFQGYGLTECAPLVAANYPGTNCVGSVGKPVDYMQVKIDNGEILVKGDGVMLGYYKNEEATAEVLQDGWFRTGDLGYQDINGFLYITGRSKNLIILGNGKNIYPEELEEHLLQLENVKDAMVYEEHGKICALLQPIVKSDDLRHEIKKQIRELNDSMPTYKRITGIEYRYQDFPKTTTMKTKRRELMEWLANRKDKKQTEYIAPVTAEQLRIAEAFQTALSQNRVGIKDDFFEIGGDSLTAMEAAMILGIHAQEIYDYPTIEKLEEALKRQENDSNRENYVDVNELIKHNNNLEIESKKPQYVLLTGATGFFGAHILRELLKRHVNVVCLVRNADKLKPTLREYFPKEYEYFNYKIVKGDVELEHFGLSDDKYELLTERVDMVIHTAANVHHAGNYADFERTNVLGTKHVIDFCKDANAILQHTSTASVNGAGTVKQTNPSAVFDEFNLDIGQQFKQNVYIHSKYKAEELVLLAREEGLKANIYRIGNLTWRMSDGKFQKNAEDSGFLGRFRGFLKVGMYSKEIAQYPIDFTAVDECADAYVRLALHNRVNNIYNMYNPHLLRIEEISNKMLVKTKLVTKEVFELALKKQMQHKEVAVLSFYNAIASSSDNIKINNDFTVKELKKLGFTWSKISLKYLAYIRTII